ncbi:MAG: YCF48-related protein [Ignavibacteria bacterium]
MILRVKIFFFVAFAFTRLSYSQSGWIQQNSSVKANLYSVEFINSQTGICVGDSGRILRTTNGGVLWNIISSGYMSGLKSIDLVNATTGFIAGDSGLLLKTSNCGINWTNFGFNSHPFDQVFFVNESVGYLVSSSGEYFYKTSNIGNTWDSIYSNYAIKKIFFINETTGWSSGAFISGDAVLKTTNSGTNWATNLYLGNGDKINSVFFLDSLKGWLGSPNSMTGATIFRTTNGGNNWYDFFPFTESYSNSIFFINSLKGWACGTSGRILYSSNGGVNWNHQLTFVPNRNYNSLDFTDSTTGWCVGDSGTILKTTTGGVLTNFSNTAIEIPDKYFLSQNYPNPFNPISNFEFGISELRFVTLKIYDILGNEVATLVNEYKPAGVYNVEWNASDFPSGVYLYKLVVDGNVIDIKRMILLK